MPEELNSACLAQTKLRFSGTLSAPVELFKKIIKNLLKKKLINPRKKLIKAPVSGRPPELTKWSLVNGVYQQMTLSSLVYR